MYRVTNVETVI